MCNIQREELDIDLPESQEDGLKTEVTGSEIESDAEDPPRYESEAEVEEQWEDELEEIEEREKDGEQDQNDKNDDKEEEEEREEEDNEGITERILKVSTDFRHMLREVTAKRNECWFANRNAHMTLDRKVAAVNAARKVVGEKEVHIKNIRTRLEALQEQLEVAEEDLVRSRDILEDCQDEEAIANRDFRNTAKKTAKFEMALRLAIENLHEFTQPNAKKMKLETGITRLGFNS